MRCSAIHLLGLFVVLSFVQPSIASHPFGYQGHEIRVLEQLIHVYQYDNGEYPLTDNQSTWYQKLNVAGTGYYIRKETPDGSYPLDYYGHPLVYETPSPSNGNRVVIRSIGPNGVDDQGALDDWDSRFGPNIGYWYKRNWPAANRRALICGLLSVIGIVVIFLRIKQVFARLVYICLWVGLLWGVVLPIGFDNTAWGRSSASIDPDWIGPVSGIGVLILLAGIFFLLIHVLYMIWYRRHLLLTGAVPCDNCRYDLRGTISANIDRCPECGHPVSVYQSRNFNPPSP